MNSLVSSFPSPAYHVSGLVVDDLFDFDIVAQGVTDQENTIAALEDITHKETLPLPAMMPQTTQSVETDNRTITGAKRKSTEPKEKAVKRRKTSKDNTSPYNSADDQEPKQDVDETKQKSKKRLVKNREAAQLFRRQKNYIQDLEKKVESLIADNQQTASKAELLESENRLLRDQLNYLRGFLTQIMTMAFPMPTAASTAALAGIPNFNFDSQASAPTANNPVQIPPPMVPTSTKQSTTPNATTTPTEGNPAYSVAAAFQAAMGFSTQTNPPNGKH